MEYGGGDKDGEHVFLCNGVQWGRVDMEYGGGDKYVSQ